MRQDCYDEKQTTYPYQYQLLAIKHTLSEGNLLSLYKGVSEIREAGKVRKQH